MALSKSDFAGDGSRPQKLRHGQAPEEERELRTFAPLPNEVELIRKSENRLAGAAGGRDGCRAQGGEADVVAATMCQHAAVNAGLLHRKSRSWKKSRFACSLTVPPSGISIGSIV